MTTPPSASSAASSYTSGAADSNEVPQEYLIASTPPLPPLSTQHFVPFPPQQPSSSMPAAKPLDPLTFHDNAPWSLQQHSPLRPPQTTTQAAPPGPSSHHRDQQSSTARLLREQRLSTCLNILRHVRRTLRQRHDEATARLARLSGLVAQSTWDLFYRSPLDLMCHEMDMLTDAATDAILSDKSPVGIGIGSGKPSTRQESDAWMEQLDKLRDLRDDEDEARRRVGKLARQMETASAMMRVGTAEQSAVLARSDAPVRGYHYLHQRGFAQPPTMLAPLASSSRNLDVSVTTTDANAKAAAPAPKSSFFNWPLPATASKGKQAAVASEEEESSGTSSGLDSPRECKGECCRRLTS